MSRFTECTLKQLIKRKFSVRSVVLDGYGPSFESFHQTQSVIHSSRPNVILEICRNHNIPFYICRRPLELLPSFQTEIKGDIFLLSCYPKRLPKQIVNLARVACINIHPSKLPKYRGSNPIFWQLKYGELDTGVTLHSVSEQIDAGDILAFKLVNYDRGSRLANIEQEFVKTAVEILEELIGTSSSEWLPVKQEAELSTWFPPPCDNDFTLGTDCDVETAFNFIRAYAKSSRPIVIRDGAQFHRAVDASRENLKSETSLQNQAQNVLILNFSNGQIAIQTEDKC